MLVVVTRPLPRDGGMAEDHGAPEAGQLRRTWTKGGAAQRIRGWTGHNEVRGILGPMSAGAAGNRRLCPLPGREKMRNPGNFYRFSKKDLR